MDRGGSKCIFFPATEATETERSSSNSDSVETEAEDATADSLSNETTELTKAKSVLVELKWSL